MNNLSPRSFLNAIKKYEKQLAKSETSLTPLYRVVESILLNFPHFLTRKIRHYRDSFGRFAMALIYQIMPYRVKSLSTQWGCGDKLSLVVGAYLRRPLRPLRGLASVSPPTFASFHSTKDRARRLQMLASVSPDFLAPLEKRAAVRCLSQGYPHCKSFSGAD